MTVQHVNLFKKLYYFHVEHILKILVESASEKRLTVNGIDLKLKKMKSWGIGERGNELFSKQVKNG
jgi:hypothetical protein